MAEKICAVYRITNTITGDFYIGSSKNVKKRWNEHKCKSSWNKQPNNPMYLDMQNYGIDKFEFEIIASRQCEKKDLSGVYVSVLRAFFFEIVILYYQKK